MLAVTLYAVASLNFFAGNAVVGLLCCVAGFGCQVYDATRRRGVEN